MPNWKKVIVSGSDATLSSVTATAGFTGSLQGTASYANTSTSASWAPSTPTFPYTGSAIISGSLEITGSLFVQDFGKTNIDSSTRQLYDAGPVMPPGAPSVVSVDWGNRYLQDTSGTPSTDWANRITYDNLGNTSFDWGIRSLLDSSNTVAANWDAFALNYKIETYTYLKKFIDTGTQELFSDVPYIGSFNYEGEVIEAAVDGTVNQFDLVYLETDGKWYPVTQGTADCSKLLGICAVNGARAQIVLEGSITINDGSYTDTPLVQSPSHGLPIYIRESAGNIMSTVVPTTLGEYVRILGHVYHQQTGTPEYWIMKFRPSNEWIVI